MVNKIQRELHYAKLLKECQKRHLIKNKPMKKEKRILFKEIDWNKLNNYVNKN
jgi:hypothetical protein